MKNHQEYIYSFINASCTLRVIEHLRGNYQPYLGSVAVINLVDRWLIKLDIDNSLNERAHKNLKAFLNEMGVVSQPTTKILDALASLDRGEPAVNVMNRYQVVVVAHGKPETEEIEIFRTQIVDRLGYCPQNMS